LLFLSLLRCQERAGPAPVASAEPARVTVAAPSASANPPQNQPKLIDSTRYPWLADASLKPPAPVDTLDIRFTPPAGFSRVKLEPSGLGAWMRTLPLAASDTPVRAYDGRELHPATDPRIAAVMALDVSRSDLQQCADTVIRLHAEWLWSQGRRDMTYRAASGTPLPFSRWANGERLVSRGADIAWSPGAGSRVDDHAGFRKYLDAVFAWANTVSLDKQAKKPTPDQVRPGDFFILPGNPGHAVMILDIATHGSERRALLGQSYMPAQNAQVLRPPGQDSPWFTLEPDHDVDTPFWKPFPWTSLRRLD
jgi:hypothetical protein